MSQGIFILLNAVIAAAFAVLARWMEQSAGVAVAIGLAVFTFACLLQAVQYFRSRVFDLEQELDEIEEEQDAYSRNMNTTRSLMNDLADAFEQTLINQQSGLNPAENASVADSPAARGKPKSLSAAAVQEIPESSGHKDVISEMATIRSRDMADGSHLQEVAALEDDLSSPELVDTDPRMDMEDRNAEGGTLAGAMAVTAGAGMATALNLAVQEEPAEMIDPQPLPDLDPDLELDPETRALSSVLKEKVEELAAARSEAEAEMNRIEMSSFDEDLPVLGEENLIHENGEDALPLDTGDEEDYSAALDLLEEGPSAEIEDNPQDEGSDLHAAMDEEFDEEELVLEPAPETGSTTLSSRIASAVNRPSREKPADPDQEKTADDSDFVDITAELAGKDVSAEIAALENSTPQDDEKSSTSISDWLEDGVSERPEDDNDRSDQPVDEAFEDYPATDEALPSDTGTAGGLPSLDALLDSFGPEAVADLEPVEADDPQLVDTPDAMSAATVLSSATAEKTDAPLDDSPVEEAGEKKEFVIRPDVLDVISYAMEHNTVDLFLQPVLSMPDREIRFFEGYSRIRGPDGEYVMPGRYMKAAIENGVISEIDNLLLIRCVQIVRTLKKAGRDIGVFCNISLHSLQDEDFFAEFVAFLRENKELSESISFELSQETVKLAGDEEWERVRELAMLGFSFSMDTVTEWIIDFGLMARRGFKFIKLDAETMKKGMADKGALVRAEDLKENLSALGISLVVEKIEDEETLKQAVAYGVDYVQGFHLGKPEKIDDVELG